MERMIFENRRRANNVAGEEIELTLTQRPETGEPHF